MEAFVVYKIENINNGKAYVGRTNDVKRRLKEHIQKSSSSLIHRAIKKHGIENFSIRILFATDSLQESQEKELELIVKENSLFPNGYNLTLKPNPVTYRQSRTQEGKPLRKRTKTHIGNKKERKRKGGPPTSLMKSSNLNLSSVRCSVLFNGKKLRKTFPTAALAAEAYDKMVLFLKGERAILNFPEKLEDYLAEDLGAFYQNFISTTKSSKYLGVMWDKRSKKWKAFILLPNKKHKTVQPFENEEDAAETYDKIALFLKGAEAKINFEGRREEFLKEDLQKFYFENACKKKTSKYKYILQCQTSKKWKFSFRRDGENITSEPFLTEEDAYQALLGVLEAGNGPNRKQRDFTK